MLPVGRTLVRLYDLKVICEGNLRPGVEAMRVSAACF